MLKLKEIRKSKGFTQEYMAKQLNITNGGYSQIENEKYTMNISTLSKLADILECSTDEILGRPEVEEVLKKNAIKYFNMMVNKDQDK